MKSRGAFIVLVGPDGVGKTAAAIELVKQTGGVYFHFRPPLWRGWDHPVAGEVRAGQGNSVTSTAGSVVRLVTNLMRFWAGYLISVRPALASGVTVVGDRWAYGYLAKPGDLRYHGPRSLSRLLIGWFPRPDLVAALVAPPELIVARKSELDLETARRDLTAWSSLSVRGLQHFDATRPAAVVAAEIQSVAYRRGPDHRSGGTATNADGLH